MVSLLSKSDIQALNIDTVERAIVFSCTVLRASLVGTDNKNNKATDIRISQNISKDGNFILLESSIPYDSFSFNKFGGNLLRFINELSTATVAIDSIDYRLSISSPSTPVIPDYDDSYIDSFERYLVYYAFILQATLGSKNEYVDIKTLDENNTGAILKLKFKFPFDYSKWLLGSNYVGTVQRIVTDNYNDTRNYLFVINSSQIDTNNNSNFLDNSNLLDNNILLTN
ncbi:MAG: hypothetical protein QNJ65_05490 [Xenococcaceae cyanobacterium MO_234.B1]|nr:hypothetical protein [Xenococcaceae cyanobacterium MO_234.B1]